MSPVSLSVEAPGVALPAVPDIADARLAQALQAALDNKTKPLGSLGRLEELALKLGQILGNATPALLKKLAALGADMLSGAERQSAALAKLGDERLRDVLRGRDLERHVSRIDGQGCAERDLGHGHTGEPHDQPRHTSARGHDEAHVGEVLDARPHLLDDAFGLAAGEAFVFGQRQQMLHPGGPAFAQDRHTPLGQLLGAGESKVVGRSELPLSVPIQKAMVLAMIVAIAGDHIECGPPERAPDFALVLREAPRNPQESFVIQITAARMQHGGEGVVMDALRAFAVETLHREMPLHLVALFGFEEPRFGHLDAGRPRHQPGHAAQLSKCES